MNLSHRQRLVRLDVFSTVKFRTGKRGGRGDHIYRSFYHSHSLFFSLLSASLTLFSGKHTQRSNVGSNMVMMRMMMWADDDRLLVRHHHLLATKKKEGNPRRTDICCFILQLKADCRHFVIVSIGFCLFAFNKMRLVWV